MTALAASPLALYPLSPPLRWHLPAPSRPLPGFLVRKEVKERGTEKQVEGNMIDGGNVLIVEDVTTTGGSSMQAIEAVKRERNGNVPIVVTIVDRLQAHRRNFRMKGIG